MSSGRYREMAKNSGKGILFMIVLLILGLVIGSFLGSTLGNYVPVLNKGYDFSVSTHTWNLGVIQFTIGFLIKINMFSIVGILIAYILYKKL